MTLKFWTNQTVQMQSAIGTAQTITGITKASPGVVTTSGTPPTNGQYLLMTVTGMTQVHNRLFKAAGVSGSTFNLGVDTSAFGTFGSSMKPNVTNARTKPGATGSMRTRCAASTCGVSAAATAPRWREPLVLVVAWLLLAWGCAEVAARVLIGRVDQHEAAPGGRLLQTGKQIVPHCLAFHACHAINSDLESNRMTEVARYSVTR